MTRAGTPRMSSGHGFSGTNEYRRNRGTRIQNSSKQLPIPTAVPALLPIERPLDLQIHASELFESAIRYLKFRTNPTRQHQSKGKIFAFEVSDKHQKMLTDSAYLIQRTSHAVEWLMIEHGIGVSEEHAYSVKKIDSDYFEEA